MTSDPSWRRRRLLAGGALGLLTVNVPTAAVGTPLPGKDYLSRLRLALGLEAASGPCAQRIHACVDLTPDAWQLVAQGADRLEAAIGDAWSSAAHTIPSLVDEDVRLGRTILVGGLALTPIELALLVG